MAPDPHDRALEDWVLAKVAGLDREGLTLGLGIRELPVPGVAEAAALDERVVAVVLDRLRARGLLRAIEADPPRVVLTPEGRRGAAAQAAAQAGAAPTEPPPVDAARFVFLRPQAPQKRDWRDADDVCDFHPSRRRSTTRPGEHCDGSGWIVDEGREARPCRCRPLRIRRARDRALGGFVTPEIRNLALATSLAPELHPALHGVVAGWTHDVDRHLDEGRGLWMTLGPWDRQGAATLGDDELDDTIAPPQTQEEFAAASARAAALLDADAVGAATRGENGARASGALDFRAIEKEAQTAAGAAGAAIARAAAIAERSVAYYSLSSLHRSLAYLSQFGGYRARLDALRGCDLLVLTGLDVVTLRRASPRQRAWLCEQLELIAYGRYEDRRATVLISAGWPLEQLVEALTPETFHRLFCAAGEPLLASRIPEHARS